MDDSLPALGDLEREVMQLVWANGPVTAEAVRERLSAKAVQRIVDWFCNGSVEEVLVGMVDTAMLDQRQLRMLADQVAKAKAKGGKKRCWRFWRSRRCAP